MEIDITAFFENAAPADYSASPFELGQDAGRITWNAAKQDSADYVLIQTDEQREAFRAHVKGFGAWDDAEIAAWDDTELNALFIQLISGDMREADLHADMTDDEWVAYETDENAVGNIYRGDDGRVYYYLGN